MKKWVAMLVFSLSVCQLAYTQTNKFDNIWFIGGIGGNADNMRLLFNGIGVAPVIVPVNVISNPLYIGGHSNICDTNGNLLFSTDGFSIFDNNCNMLQNGDSLISREYHIGVGGGNSLSQTSIILPFPNKKYYVFTPSVSDSIFINEWQAQTAFRFDELFYHIVDMNANGGMGAVVRKKVQILKNKELNLTNMMACRHGNGKDWWLFKQAKDTNMVYKFLVTEDSVYNYGVQGFAEPHFWLLDNFGQAMFNQDASQYAICVQGGGGYDTSGPSASPGNIFVADFDRCTGELSNPIVYQTKKSLCSNMDPNCFENFNQGLCFSPNGRFLYVSSYYSIKQLDLWDTDTTTQWSYVFGLKMDGYFGSLYNAPDGKIYVGNTSNGYKAMTVIDSPDVKGMGCSVCYKCLAFPDYGVSSPPCMPNYHLGAKVPCWPLAIDEQIVDKNVLEVFPNPSSTVFYIKNKNGKKKELYNAIGELIFTTFKEEIEVKHIAKGMYYIRCEGLSKKVVVE